MTLARVGDAVPDVRGGGGVHGVERLERRVAGVLQQPLTIAEQQRRDVEVELVEQAGGERLLDGLCAAGDEDVLPARLARLRDRRLDAVGDEEERRAALHRDGLAWVVREDEGRGVERWVLAP